MRQFVKKVEETALGVKVIKGVRPDQMLVRVVSDELVQLMGGQKEDLVDPDDGPQVSPAVLRIAHLRIPQYACSYPLTISATSVSVLASIGTQHVC